MNKFKSDLTIILVSFKSKEKIVKLLTKLNKNHKIIVVENSNDKSLEKKFFKSKNISFYYPHLNKGFAGGLNYGVNKAKTKFILYLDIDTKINSLQIKKLYNKVKNISDFGAVTAKIKGQNYKDLILGRDKITKMNYVKFNTGCVMFFNRKTFLKLGGFDERFFLYFEESDFYERCMYKDKKIFLFEDILVEHEGGSSIDSAYKKKYEILRNWHYCWSKFNFYYKHKNYFVAFSKTFPNLVKSLKGIILSLINLDTHGLNMHFAEAGGIISAYLRFSSFYRIK